MKFRSRVLLIAAAILVAAGLLTPTDSSAFFTKVASTVSLPDGAINVLGGTGVGQSAGRIDVIESTPATLSPAAPTTPEVVFTIQTAGVTFSNTTGVSCFPASCPNMVVLLGDGGSGGTFSQVSSATVTGGGPTSAGFTASSCPTTQLCTGVGTFVAPRVTTTSGVTRINSATTIITVAITGASSRAAGTVRLQNVFFNVGSTAAQGPVTVRVSGSATSPSISGITQQDVSNATIVAAGTSASVTTSPVPSVVIGRLDRSAGTVRIRELVPGAISGSGGVAGNDLTVTLPAGVTFGASMTAAPTTGTTSASFLQTNNCSGAVTAAAFTTGRSVLTSILGNAFLNTGSTVCDILLNASSLTAAGMSFDVASTVASGPINVTIAGGTGTNITAATVAPAIAVSGGTTFVASGPAPGNVVIGRAAQSQSATQVVLSEVAPQTLTGGVGLGVDLTAPTGATYAATPAIPAQSGFAIGAGSLTSGSRVATYPVTASSTGTAGTATFGPFSFGLAFTVPVGSIQVSVGGSAGATAGSVTVANAIRATTSTSPTTPIKSVVIGTQNQPTGDLTITENFAGALEVGAGCPGAAGCGFSILLPPGATFASRPTVAVSAGNIGGVTSPPDPTGTSALTLNPSAASTIASVINISGINVTLDNTVPVGPLAVRLKNTGGTVAAANPPVAAGAYSRPFEETVNIAQVSPGTRPVVNAPAANAIVTRGATTTVSWTAETPPVASNYALEYTGAGRTFANPRSTAADTVNGFTGAGGGFITGPAATTTINVVPSTSAPTGNYQIRIFPLSAAFQVPTGVTSSDAVSITLQ